MITAVHTLIYSDDPAATRAFFRDVLELPWVSDADYPRLFEKDPFAPDEAEDALILIGLQPMASDEVGRNVDVVLEHGQSPRRRLSYRRRG